jgi:hypothetical protein
MNKIKYILTLFLAASMMTACEYRDENTDPTRQSNVDNFLILPAAQSQAAFNQMASASRLSAIMMQHYDGFDAQQIEYMIYDINENALNNMWNTGLYGGVMKDCKVIEEKALETEGPHYQAISKILMANALGTATSLFGDVPYSEAFLGLENLKPAYDSQESVYASIQTLLDEAIVLLGGAAGLGDATLSQSDLIYGGDAASWTQTAYAFKARYYMHLTKRDGSASAKAITAIGNAYGSSADQADYAFESAAAFANPLAQFAVGRPNTIVMNPGFVAALDANADPRRSIIADAAGLDFFTGQAEGLFWSINAAPSPLISYTELKFLHAEALARTGAGAAANTALQEAVTSNMMYIGVDAADATTYTTAMSDISGMSEAAAIQAIIEEAYVGLYAQAELEIWTNYRRTGFPAITPNAQGTNGQNPSGVVPRRIPYAQNERITNLDSYNAAIANQNGNLLDDDLWAFDN